MDIHPKIQPGGHVVLLLCRVDLLPGCHLADQIREASQEKVIQFECLLGLRPQDLQPSFLPRIVGPRGRRQAGRDSSGSSGDGSCTWFEEEGRTDPQPVDVQQSELESATVLSSSSG